MTILTSALPHPNEAPSPSNYTTTQLRPTNATLMAFPTSPLSYYTFAILEPLLQITGFCIASFAPDFYASSLRSAKQSPKQQSPPTTDTIVVFQLGNLFLLVAVIGLYVLHSTPESAVATAYLSALWWGDLGHIGVTAWCIGWQGMSDSRRWNLVTSANVGVPVGLFVARNLYFYGPSF